MKQLLVILTSLPLAFNVYAACTTTTVLTPDGKYVVCNTCCDANNNCNVVCI